MLDRRAFIGGCAAAGVVAALPAGPLVPYPGDVVDSTKSVVTPDGFWAIQYRVLHHEDGTTECLDHKRIWVTKGMFHLAASEHA